MSKETNLTLTAWSIFTQFGPVTSWVEPTFENAVSELTTVAFPAVPFPEISTSSAGVMILPRIPPASFLAGMCVRTLGPVMGSATWTLPDFELEHPEMIARVSVDRRIRVFENRKIGIRVENVRFVRRQVTL